MIRATALLVAIVLSGTPLVALACTSVCTEPPEITESSGGCHERGRSFGHIGSAADHECSGRLSAAMFLVEPTNRSVSASGCCFAVLAAGSTLLRYVPGADPARLPAARSFPARSGSGILRL